MSGWQWLPLHAPSVYGKCTILTNLMVIWIISFIIFISLLHVLYVYCMWLHSACIHDSHNIHHHLSVLCTGLSVAKEPHCRRTICCPLHCNKVLHPKEAFTLKLEAGRHVAYHFVLRIYAHRCLQERFVKKGHSGLDAKGKRGFVGSCHIPQMQPLHLPHCLPACAVAASACTKTQMGQLWVCGSTFNGHS